MIKSIKFINFKTHKNLTISLNKFNVLVGPNNSGKSTILDALRVLAGAYRLASRRKPTLIELPDGKTRFGYYIPESSIPISLRHVHTDYNEQTTSLQYKLQDNKSITIIFPPNKSVILCYDGEPKNIRTAAAFRKEFPLNLAIVPTLGPLEEDEEIHREDYVKRWQGSHRAPRLFRNTWFYDNSRFEVFKEIIEETWKGVSIELPEQATVLSPVLNMYCSENRMAREIFWAGNGFQIWLQLLTHIIKSQNADFIVIDEPEIYLHPDLQRKLISILRDLEMNVVIATHSIEIINEVEPDEVLIIEKFKKRAKRLTDLIGLQSAVDILGSTQNIHLTRLARGKKVLFVEGQDSKFIEKFSKILGFSSLINNGELTIIPIGGFSQWEKIAHAQWAFSGVLGEEIKTAALFDRDYRSKEEVKDFEKNLTKKVSFIHVLRKKEIENYLLIPKAIEKAINKQLNNRINNGVLDSMPEFDIEKILFKITDSMRNDVQGQIIEHEYHYLIKNGSKETLATVSSRISKKLDQNWSDLTYRLAIVPGKEVFSKINQYIQEEWKISISPHSVLNQINKSELDGEINELFIALEKLVNSEAHLNNI